MKKAIIVVGTIIVLLVAYYLLSPLWNVVEVEEASPLAGNDEELTVVDDRMDDMSEEEKQLFEQEVMDANKEEVIMDDTMPPEVQLLAESPFVARAHDVAGNALLIQDGDSTIVRFEDFETVNGPNLHIYLASSLGDDDFIDLGPIKATRGSVNYDVPAGVDTDKYNKVLVWCVPFGVLFSYAELG